MGRSSKGWTPGRLVTSTFQSAWNRAVSLARTKSSLESRAGGAAGVFGRSPIGAVGLRSLARRHQPRPRSMEDAAMRTIGCSAAKLGQVANNIGGRQGRLR